MENKLHENPDFLLFCDTMKIIWPLLFCLYTFPNISVSATKLDVAIEKAHQRFAELVEETKANQQSVEEMLAEQEIAQAHIQNKLKETEKTDNIEIEFEVVETAHAWPKPVNSTRTKDFTIYFDSLSPKHSQLTLDFFVNKIKQGWFIERTELLKDEGAVNGRDMKRLIRLTK